MPRITVSLATTVADRDVAAGIWAAANRARDRPAGMLRASRVREKIDRAELLLLARYGDRPAGMLLAETYLEEGVPIPEAGHLSMVFVDPAVWGSHVGTSLVRDVQARQWRSLSVWTRSDDRRARRLFEATGFAETGNRSQLQDGDEIVQLAWSVPSP